MNSGKLDFTQDSNRLQNEPGSAFLCRDKFTDQRTWAASFHTCSRGLTRFRSPSDPCCRGATRLAASDNTLWPPSEAYAARASCFRASPNKCGRETKQGQKEYLPSRRQTSCEWFCPGRVSKEEFRTNFSRPYGFEHALAVAGWIPCGGGCSA